MILTLCQIARKTLENYFGGKDFKLNQEIKEKYNEKKACFVTLTKDEQLRGCIGCLETEKELWKNLQENVLNAAFYDSRFPSLQQQELKDIKIEVSILSKPQKLNWDKEKDLINKLNKNMGILLKKDFYSSTFLPQVWEKIADKKQFLEQLSLKAGLERDAWKTAEIYFYTVKIEKE